MTTQKPDPIWDPGDVRKLENPLAYMTIVDPQIMPDQPIVMPAHKWEIFPVTDNLKNLVKRNIVKAAAGIAMDTHIDSIYDGRERAHKTPDGDAERVNFLGRMGELFVGITTNRFVELATEDFGFYADINGDEVKTRADNPTFADLLVDKGSIKSHRLYWLVVGNFPKFTNYGWTTGKVLLERGGVKDLGNRGKQWGIHKDKLFKWMPDFDPCYYIKAHANQRQLSFSNKSPWPSES